MMLTVTPMAVVWSIFTNSDGRFCVELAMKFTLKAKRDFGAASFRRFARFALQSSGARIGVHYLSC